MQCVRRKVNASDRHQEKWYIKKRKLSKTDNNRINQSINQSETDLYSATYTTRCPMALNMKLQDTTKYKITQMQV